MSTLNALMGILLFIALFGGIFLVDIYFDIKAKKGTEKRNALVKKTLDPVMLGLAQQLEYDMYAPKRSEIKAMAIWDDSTKAMHDSKKSLKKKSKNKSKKKSKKGLENKFNYG